MEKVSVHIIWRYVLSLNNLKHKIKQLKHFNARKFIRIYTSLRIYTSVSWLRVSRLSNTSFPDTYPRSNQTTTLSLHDLVDLLAGVRPPCRATS